jgi:FO synthase
MPHYGSPDKDPARRLETIRLAGEMAVPFTSGLLIGIGETRRERIESLLALRDLHQRYGHIQEIIVQNFRAKAGTKMARATEPEVDELLWTLAVARLIFGPGMSLQAPPNLNPGVLPALVDAGLNDWGGVSPLTPDYVNPEAPWPHLAQLAQLSGQAGKRLEERLTIYPAYALAADTWLDPALRGRVRQMIDALGYPRTDSWVAGLATTPAAEELALIATPVAAADVAAQLVAIVARATAAEELTEDEIVRLFAARGAEFGYVCQAADRLRREVNGDTVSYVVNRNINYTNVCYFKCRFCAFSKGKTSEDLRGQPYDLDQSEIARRCTEAWARGATEVCLQGGIHPDYTGQTYLQILQTIRAATPQMHIHAFSPLEVWQGAKTLGLPLRDFLQQLKDAGLNSLPGTAAEILDDEVRAIICPDKIDTAQWLEVIETASKVGLKATATIMFGHVEHPRHWARHLLRVRAVQVNSGGITEFVPLPFVGAEAPIYRRGGTRNGPTFREAVLMHAVARLALHGQISNIQTSWVKMGYQGAVACLNAGCNDLGGTLMNESITRAAGAQHGQETAPRRMMEIIEGAGRQPRQRTTLYGEVAEERIEAALSAAPLRDVINTPWQPRAHIARPVATA